MVLLLLILLTQLRRTTKQRSRTLLLLRHAECRISTKDPQVVSKPSNSQETQTSH